jgi:hypothetical protein
MRLDGRIFYFTSAFSIRQLSDVGLSTSRCWKGKGNIKNEDTEEHISINFNGPFVSHLKTAYGIDLNVCSFTPKLFFFVF